MIELNQLRKNKEEFVLSLKKRGLDDIENDLNKLISLDDERKSLKTKLDNLLSESNKIAKEIGIKIKSGDNDIGDLKDQSAKLKEDSKKIDKELKLTEESIKSILVNIPNIPDTKVPEGNSEDQNIEILKHEISINNVEKLKPHLKSS